MRTVLLSAALATCVMTPVLAQTGVAPAYPPAGMSQPAYPPVAQQPGYPPMGTQQPAYPPVAQQPAYPPVAQQPTYPPVAQQPAYPPVAQQPTYPPAAQQPAYPPAGSPSSPPPAGDNAQYQPPSAMPTGQHASNIDSNDTRNEVAPTLPSPSVGPDAGPAGYLRAAQAALEAGQTGETQEALEQAQTRLLDRSVPYGAVNDPSRNPAVAQISQALHALAAGDRAQCMQLIQAAQQSAVQ